MLFNSLDFLLFFPAVTLVYFFLSARARVFWLLAASCLFYMVFRPVYILILFFTILVDYWAGLLIDRAEGPRRKAWLVASLAANVGVLAVFKYFNFLSDGFSGLGSLLGASWMPPHLGLLLPIGLSFHTFQAMSYTIEVYRGRQAPERDPWVYALYVMFYPQLVAGPIERPQNLLHQFREEHRFDYRRVVFGLQRMAWGLFKKVVIADRLRMLVDSVYARPRENQGPMLVLATVFFAYVIYCDFSGYSDMALGAAEVMGFKLMENFKRPYLARSVAEFWTRWHISLSTWFRDYVYVSLGGNRVAPWRWYLNLMATFLLSGLWHGANWTYVAWGALNGAYLVGSIWTKGPRERLAQASGLARFPSARAWFQRACTFALITVSWVFFRAKNMSDAWYVLSHLHSGWSALNPAAVALLWKTVVMTLGGAKFRVLAVLAAVAATEALQLLQERGFSARRVLERQAAPLRWSLYYALGMAIVMLASYARTEFIYFQF